MVRMLVADVQRLFRGTAIYVFMGMLIVMTTTQPLGFSQGLDSSLRETGMNMPFYLMMMANNVLLFIGMSFGIIIAPDFSGKNQHGTIRNALATGFPRVTYFFSKLLFVYVLTFVLYLVHVGGGTLMATAVLGFGGTLDWAYIQSVLAPASAQLFLFMVVASIGFALSFLIKNTNVTLYAFFALFFLPAMFFPLLAEHFHGIFDTLLEYDLFLNLRQVVGISSMGTGEIIRILGVSFGLAVVMIAISLIWFKRDEIK